MTCDSGRPCQRCIKREIGHLCHDEVKLASGGYKDSRNSPATSNGQTQPSSQESYNPPENNGHFNMQALPVSTSVSNWPIIPQTQYPFASQGSGNEFSVLTDFLQSLDDRTFFGAPQNILPQTAPPENPVTTPAANHLVHNQHTQPESQPQRQHQPQQIHSHPHQEPQTTHSHSQPQPHAQFQDQQQPPQQRQSHAQELHHQFQHQPQSQPQLQAQAQAPPPPASPILPAATKAEQFLLTAADQESGSRDERLARVIHSKYEAGLLKPYPYVKGYARLSRWMDRNVSQESKQQILGPLSVLRPKFRAIAQSLKDIDLVFIEEAFERLLLDYDRVFSAMGIPACLWRRTGEIYKGNREFAELVGVEGHMLREGRLCIYELMAEESAVNYWEKYGHVAFDTGQKAVLTSCVLRYKPSFAVNAGSVNTSSLTSAYSSPVSLRPGPSGSYSNGRRGSNVAPPEQGLINCCFSFTIRRDTWGIPSMIVGNFIRH
ncbi:hypothetical protein BU17DRAFT_56011 [Hysterangium stoloniferum]|nr:hypothetical protein BU17DRAFT_56011 [Hysterangium stoloniferum]